jgi:hypothetical protein
MKLATWDVIFSWPVNYLQVFIDSVINSKGSSRPNEEENPLGSV